MLQKLRNRKGQGMSEYLIILALVAIATIGAVIFFADNVRDQISNIAGELAGADPVATQDVVGDEDLARGSYGLGTFTESAEGDGAF